MFPVRWGKRGHSIILGMCTMPKAKVSAGAELSPEISLKMSWWPWGRQQSTMSKKESMWFNQSNLTLEITSSCYFDCCVKYPVFYKASCWVTVWLHMHCQGKFGDSEGAWRSSCSGSNLWQPWQHTLPAGKLSQSRSFSWTGERELWKVSFDKEFTSIHDDVFF